MPSPRRYETPRLLYQQYAAWIPGTLGDPSYSPAILTTLRRGTLPMLGVRRSEDGKWLARSETTMLTPSEIDVLNAHLSDLTQRIGGDDNVRCSSDGAMRLTIMKHAQESGGLYRVREVIASSFRDACDQITRAVESVAA
jgi:hypothetical protein